MTVRIEAAAAFGRGAGGRSFPSELLLLCAAYGQLREFRATRVSIVSEKRPGLGKLPLLQLIYRSRSFHAWGAQGLIVFESGPWVNFGLYSGVRVRSWD